MLTSLGFVAAGSEIDDFDRTLTSRSQQNVLGLQVAVNDLLPTDHPEALQDGEGEPANQRDAEALETVPLDQLVQVDPETEAPIFADRRKLKKMRRRLQKRPCSRNTDSRLPDAIDVKVGSLTELNRPGMLYMYWRGLRHSVTWSVQ